LAAPPAPPPAEPIRKARTLPTVTPNIMAGSKAWENPNRPVGAKMTIKEKLAARRNWQQQADAVNTMSPLKAKLAARRRAKAAGTLQSTGNATPAMAFVATSLQQQQQKQGESSEMASKPISPSPTP